jgi:hypothetical protein
MALMMAGNGRNRAKKREVGKPGDFDRALALDDIERKHGREVRLPWFGRTADIAVPDHDRDGAENAVPEEADIVEIPPHHAPSQLLLAF